MSEPRPKAFDKDPYLEPTVERLLSVFRHENSWLRSRVAELERESKARESARDDDGWKAALAEIARLEGLIETANAARDREKQQSSRATSDVKFVVRRFQKSPMGPFLRRRKGWRNLEDRWGHPAEQD